ncbi:bifunctional polynucleotide phosphatase/kinase [Skeletonema marinoi]|uniref:Bifunctional polynucleotide phosphatase/kinase n=1 Tax=Skeletonema marinoi TaxID=267567 RepID=A0AAD8YDW5_9STRA|nr:bifunctional polynucleotide phosphatase/kinase [Skeletonema marinoi]
MKLVESTLLLCVCWLSALSPHPTTRNSISNLNKHQAMSMNTNHDDGGDWVDVVTTKRKGAQIQAQKQLSSNSNSNSQCILVLVGLPGSGKSYFASKLEKESFSQYVRVNQDALGTRKKCETACRQALSRGKSVIIDRCNFDATQREHWLKFGVPCECIVFNYDKELCIRRCKERRNHETIDSRNAAGVVRGMAKGFRPPLPHSPQYQRHVTITSFRKSNEIVQSYIDRISRD